MAFEYVQTSSTWGQDLHGPRILEYVPSLPTIGIRVPGQSLHGGVQSFDSIRKRRVTIFDEHHRQLALGFVERLNRSFRRYAILATHSKFRHNPSLFPRVVKDVYGLRASAHEQTTLRDSDGR